MSLIRIGRAIDEVGRHRFGQNWLDVERVDTLTARTERTRYNPAAASPEERLLFEKWEKVEKASSQQRTEVKRFLRDRFLGSPPDFVDAVPVTIVTDPHGKECSLPRETWTNDQEADRLLESGRVESFSDPPRWRSVSPVANPRALEIHARTERGLQRGLQNSAARLGTPAMLLSGEIPSRLPAEPYSPLCGSGMLMVIQSDLFRVLGKETNSACEGDNDESAGLKTREAQVREGGDRREAEANSDIETSKGVTRGRKGYYGHLRRFLERPEIKDLDEDSAERLFRGPYEKLGRDPLPHRRYVIARILKIRDQPPS
jgi:hypothetical protein